MSLLRPGVIKQQKPDPTQLKTVHFSISVDISHLVASSAGAHMHWWLRLAVEME